MLHLDCFVLIVSGCACATISSRQFFGKISAACTINTAPVQGNKAPVRGTSAQVLRACVTHRFYRNTLTEKSQAPELMPLALH